MTETLVVHPLEAPLSGSVPLPTDVHVTLPRMALAALGRGRTTFHLVGSSASIRALLDGLELFGVEVLRDGNLAATHRVVIAGAGLTGFDPKQTRLDVRGDSHVAALLLAHAAGRPTEVELLVDDVVAELVAQPLATVVPVHLEPVSAGHPREGVVVRLGAIDPKVRPDGLRVDAVGLVPWVKEAVMLFGLRAGTPSEFSEVIASRDHLERALFKSRMPIDVLSTSIGLHPPRDGDAIAPTVYEHLGSSELGFWLAAAAQVRPGSRVVLRDVSTNASGPDLPLLARLTESRLHSAARGERQGEPFGELTIESPAGHRADSAISLSGETVVRLGDAALPLMVGLSLSGRGVELSDYVPAARGGDARIVGRALGLCRSAGLRVSSEDERIVIEPRPTHPLSPLVVTTGGDARLGLLAAVLGLGASGPSRIDDVGCLRGAFPRFVGTMRALGAKMDVVSDGAAPEGDRNRPEQQASQHDE